MNPSLSFDQPVAPPLLWNTHHDQPELRRIGMITLLNRQLADLVDLGLQARQAHWNVKGPQFAALYPIFGDVARELGVLADELARRIVVLGGAACGTLQVIVRESRLSAYPLDAFDGVEHSWALSAALAHVAQTSRTAIGQASKAGDAGTAALFTEISRSVDTLLWKVEAHIALEPPRGA